MVICLELGAGLHMAQLMPLPLTVSCFSKIQIGFAFLVPAHPGSLGKELLNGCVCVTTAIKVVIIRIVVEIIVSNCYCFAHCHYLVALFYYYFAVLQVL